MNEHTQQEIEAAAEALLKLVDAALAGESASGRKCPICGASVEFLVKYPSAQVRCVEHGELIGSRGI